MGAMFSPVDAACQPPLAMKRFKNLTEQAGVDMQMNALATEIVEDSGVIKGIIVNGRRIPTRSVIVAAGIWTPHLTRTVGLNVPIMPVSLSEGETEPLAPLFQPTLRSYGFGCRQRPNGRVVFSEGVNARVRHDGSLASLRNFRLWFPRIVRLRRDVRVRPEFRTVRAEFSARRLVDISHVAAGAAPVVDEDFVIAAYKRMLTVLPDMHGSKIERTWAGYLDMSPDGLPIIDASSGPRGLVVAAGMSGHGFTLGPAIGGILADLAVDGRTHHDIGPMRLARFWEEQTAIPSRTI